MNHPIASEPSKKDLLKTIAEEKEAHEIFSCLQCGACTGSCPVSDFMPEPPRKIFALLRAGMEDRVKQSITPWICASCYTCQVRCPAKIKITEVMYLLKRKYSTNHNHNMKSFYDTFLSSVLRHGKVHEVGLMLGFMAFRKPFELLRQTPYGINLFLKGCLSIFPHRVKNMGSFKKMVRHAMALDKLDNAHHEEAIK